MDAMEAQLLASHTARPGMHLLGLKKRVPINSESPPTLQYTFTMRDAAFCTGNQLAVSYEAFAEDMQPGERGWCPGDGVRRGWWG